METERKDDARAAVHPPEERTDLVLRLALKLEVPEQQLPIKRVPLSPEWRAEKRAIRPIARGHEALEMMAGNQFMKDGGARKRRIVAAHAHHLLFMRHGVGRVRHENGFTAQKERADELSIRRHHLHAPRVTRKLRHGHQVVIVDELYGFLSEGANKFRLFAGFDVGVLHVLERFFPIVAIAELL